MFTGESRDYPFKGAELNDDPNATTIDAVVPPQADPPAPPDNDKHSNAEWARLRIAEKAAEEAKAAVGKAEAEAKAVKEELEKVRSTAVSKDEAAAEVNKVLLLAELGIPMSLRDMFTGTDPESLRQQAERLRSAFPAQQLQAQPPENGQAPPTVTPPATISPPPPPRKEQEVDIEAIADPAEQAKAYKAEWIRLQKAKQ